MTSEISYDVFVLPYKKTGKPQKGFSFELPASNYEEALKQYQTLCLPFSGEITLRRNTRNQESFRVSIVNVKSLAKRVFSLISSEVLDGRTTIETILVYETQ